MSQNNIPKGQLSTIILSTLLSGDKYGYEIIKEIKEKTDGQLEIKQPSLYSSLSRMEKQGFISSYWKDSEIGGKRHYYRLTDLGKKQFDRLEESFYTGNAKINTCLESKIESEFKNITLQPKNPNLNEEVIDNNTKEQNHNTELLDSPTAQGNLFDSDKIDLNKKRFDLESEINKISTKQKSFSDNIKEEIPVIQNSQFIEKYQDDTIIIPSSEEKIQPLNNAFESEKANSPSNSMIENENETTEDSVFLDNNKQDIDYLINDENKIDVPNNLDYLNNYSQNVNNINNALNDKTQKNEEQHKDDAVFINDRIPEEQRPKVKKLDIAYITNDDNDLSQKLLATNLESGYTEKINMLYNKSNQKIIPIDSIQQDENLTYKQLKDYYKSKNIRFSVYNNDTIVKKQDENIKHNKNNWLFKKYFLLFIIVLAETVTTVFIFKALNVITNYQFLYYIIPILCFIPVIYFRYVPQQSENKNAGIMFEILVFAIGLVLIYSINMLIGMNLNNIISYATTFIYPTIIWTNIIVSAIYNYFHFKDKKFD